MDLLQCVSPTFPDNRTRKSALSTTATDRPMRRSPTRSVRQVQSEERDVQRRQGNSLPVQRRISLPAGHYAASPGSASRGTSPAVSSKSEFKHYGSSLSLTNRTGSVASELTSRTLRPPSPTVLRKISTSSITSTSSTSSNRSTSSSRPPLPNIKVDLEPPKLADYLERPRLVSTLHVKKSPGSDRAQVQHSKHPIKDVSQYRNLRFGNFMEIPETEQDELIPERLRQYYLETYLNVCATCESLTCDPTSPIHRGM